MGSTPISRTNCYCMKDNSSNVTYVDFRKGNPSLNKEQSNPFDKIKLLLVGLIFPIGPIFGAMYWIGGFPLLIFMFIIFIMMVAVNWNGPANHTLP
jgi:hypothetical protein